MPAIPLPEDADEEWGTVTNVLQTKPDDLCVTTRLQRGMATRPLCLSHSVSIPSGALLVLTKKTLTSQHISYVDHRMVRARGRCFAISVQQKRM